MMKMMMKIRMNMINVIAVLALEAASQVCARFANGTERKMKCVQIFHRYTHAQGSERCLGAVFTQALAVIN